MVVYLRPHAFVTELLDGLDREESTIETNERYHPTTRTNDARLSTGSFTQTGLMYKVEYHRELF